MNERHECRSNGTHRIIHSNPSKKYPGTKTPYPNRHPTSRNIARRRRMSSHRSSDAYQADDEDFPGERRFSDHYDHGYSLCETVNPLAVNKLNNASMSRKRTPSDALETPSPKRVRFESAQDLFPIQANEISTITKPSAKFRGMSQHFSNDIAPIPAVDTPNHSTFLSHSYEHLFLKLSQSPQVLSIGQISGLFQAIQKDTEIFARCWFGNRKFDERFEKNLTTEDFASHDLEYSHPALYWTLMNILDISTDKETYGGWLRFLAAPEYRQYLVYGILGEWITQRVFKDTAFGLDASGRREMQSAVDDAYLHFDAFVRAKRRSQIVKLRIGSENHASFLVSLQKACQELAEELITVLAPLLPTFKLDNLSGQNQSQGEADWNLLIKADLTDLISKCAALNLSVVCTGINGTVIRIAARFENGKPFMQDAPVRCVNEELVAIQQNQSMKSQDDTLVVKMTCWPRVEAYVPHGMDMYEMGALQKQLNLRCQIEEQTDTAALNLRYQDMGGQKIENVNHEFCWDCAGAQDCWDILPKDLWPAATRLWEREGALLRSANVRQIVRQRTGAEGKASLGDAGGSGDDSSSSSSCPTPDAYDQLRDEDACQSENDRTTKKHSKRTRIPKRCDKHRSGDLPLRGSWLTFYDCIAPHIVYCEWIKLDAGVRKEFNLTQDTVQRKRTSEVNEILEAIPRARRQQNMTRTGYRDAVLKLHDLYVSNNLWIEWGTLLALVVYWLRGLNTVAATCRFMSGNVEIFTSLAKRGFGKIVLAVQSFSPNPIQATSHITDWLSRIWHAYVDRMFVGLNDYYGCDTNAMRANLCTKLAAITSILPRPACVEDASEVATEDVTEPLKAVMSGPVALMTNIITCALDHAESNSAQHLPTSAELVPVTVLPLSTEAISSDTTFRWLTWLISGNHPFQDSTVTTMTPTPMHVSPSFSFETVRDDKKMGGKAGSVGSPGERQEAVSPRRDQRESERRWLWW